jgi:dihydrofolate reductase
MTLSHIVCMAKNGVIGRGGIIPWYIPEELAYFKARTTGHVVIMGRKTFQSIKSPLKNRMNIVITSKPKAIKETENLKFVDSIESAIELAKGLDKTGEVFVIGGAAIYEKTLPMTDKIYMTVIDKVIEGDVYYPQTPKEFVLADTTKMCLNEKLSFLTLVKGVRP